MTELISRLDFYIKKFSAKGWIMPNTVELLKDVKKEIQSLQTNSLTEDKIKNKLEYLKNIESRFFGWSLSVQQEVDFAWVVRELKKRVK